MYKLYANIIWLYKRLQHLRISISSKALRRQSPPHQGPALLIVCQADGDRVSVLGRPVSYDAFPTGGSEVT